MVVAPLWAPLLVAAAVSAPAWLRRRRRLRSPHACPSCGYDARALSAGAPCPECGRTRCAA